MTHTITCPNEICQRELMFYLEKVQDGFTSYDQSARADAFIPQNDNSEARRYCNLVIHATSEDRLAKYADLASAYCAGWLKLSERLDAATSLLTRRIV